MKPMVNVYELDDEGVEQLVYREMNDEEFEVWTRDQEAAAAFNVIEQEHPVLAQVRDMSSEDRAALKTLLTEEV